jgi:hypothetical protein
MAPDSGGVMGMFWGLLACVHVSGSRRSSMSGACVRGGGTDWQGSSRGEEEEQIDR